MTINLNSLLDPTIVAGGDVVAPATTSENKVPQWSSTAKTLKDGLVVGTAANNLVQLNASAQLPAVDGSLLVNACACNVTITVKAKVAVKKGQAVFVTPGNAAMPDVDLCDNTNTVKSRVLGVMTDDVSAGATGYVRRYGALTNVDTRTTNTYINPNGETWVEGDLLFATTGGGLTKVRPTSGRCVKVAYSVTGSKNTDTLLLFPMENPVWVTAAASEGVVLRLGDSSGATKVSIRDYTNAEVASIDSDGKIVGDGSGITGIFTWSEVTGTAQGAAVGNGYIANNAELVTVTLPATAPIGSVIKVVGKGAGMWKIAQAAGQQIVSGASSSTLGDTGYMSAAAQYDTVELVCITADTLFSVVNSTGSPALA